MIRALIADDSERKVDLVVLAMRQVLEEDELVIDRASTVVGAARCLRNSSYDLLVVDLNMPMREGEEAASDGGLILIRRLQRKGSDLRVPTHIVGLTAFESLAADYARHFDGHLWHLVKFDDASDSWSRQIAEKLLHIASSKAVNGGTYDIDLAIVTALDAVELDAILALDGKWRPSTAEESPILFHLGEFAAAMGRHVRVVAASAGEMGMASATALSMSLISRFRPRYLIMAGIAAGYEGEFGDILVASHAWDYGAGKNRYKEGRSVFLPAPSQIQMSPLLRAQLSFTARDAHVMRRIRAGWKGEGAPAREPVVRVGPMASGAAVLENRQLIEEIKAQNRKLVGIEMEAYGVYMAARLCDAPRPMVGAVKSVCDFGDDTKSDAFQAYAAYTSARFVYEFAIAHVLAAGD